MKSPAEGSRTHGDDTPTIHLHDPRVDGLSFEISCIEGRDRYCTVGLDIPQPCREGKGKQVESEEEREIRWGIEMLSLRDGDYTVRLFSGHPREPISQASKLIVSAATCGNVKELESLLSDSPDPQSLLKARFDGDGVPLLSLAVCNGHSEAVTYLINKGVDVNAADFKGRTALMEAALWSHPLIVDKLLIAGANRNMRDSSGMLAADFAEESEANDEERNRRHLKYSENPFFAKRNRKIIRGLLGHTFVRTKGKWLELKELDDAFFYKSPQARTISFVTPSTGLPIRYMSKTAAFLDRGSPFPVVSAVSGYLGPDNQEFLTATESFERLNPGHWMPETVRLAQAFGFDFARHDHDQPGIPGSYYACHAESMLMCFFVMRNYIFRDYKSGETVNDDFLQLFMLQPRNQRARIIVSHEPCLSCVKLKDCIRAKLDIEFELKVVRVRDP
ncbi:hypothetical protein C7999DRAFT_41811 [Corynascus novoguineensis]|uniref:Single-strand DNA deaminase toxin A-like C-terminal domain-containing protein n=1 Tax=Corynascus novoguineensis TaxID=1126955 RepID=A0AAN7CRS4_9PEZI|nr:hypothetical protein C7999DRAFT_41811 [Corynascus novoguineensis]